MAQHEITRLLASARDGNQAALHALLPLVYEELRAIAHRTSPGRSDTLNTTALVHEAFLKLHASEQLSIQDRRHFFAIAARAMRQIVVDRARREKAEKRGGGAKRVNLDETSIAIQDCASEILALEDAMRHLFALDEGLGQVVELRFFGGLTIEETAEALGLDPRTVTRRWRKARAILYLTLHGDGEPWPADPRD